MATNLLALPLVQLSVYTGNNEDWIDTLQFLDVDGNPIALTGISFAMEVRKGPPDHTVLLEASTDNGLIAIAGSDFSYLAIRVPIAHMSDFLADSYVADIVGQDATNARVIIQVTPLQVFEGITR
jgi:hypothetical protein